LISGTFVILIAVEGGLRTHESSDLSLIVLVLCRYSSTLRPLRDSLTVGYCGFHLIKRCVLEEV